VQIGQRAKTTIDAFPEQSFGARVTEIGNSPIQQQTAQQTGGSRQATTFKVVVTLDDAPENLPLRPGFTCTADITTATRKSVVSVPIQATAVREVVLDAKGQIVRAPAEEGRRRRRTVETSLEAQELAPGQTREEVEGVFVVRDNRAVFVRIKTGIAGDKYFEVLDGLKEGDQVIVGPFSSVRDMEDGDAVKVEQARSR
jgi:HlyD family secretion protein